MIKQSLKQNDEYVETKRESMEENKPEEKTVKEKNKPKKNENI
jgi:hypothetical protein